MRRAVLTAVAATVLTAFAGVVVLAVPADATENKRENRLNSEFGAAQCPSRAICLFTDRNWRGAKLIDKTGRGLARYGSRDDTTGSIVNNSTETVCFFEFENFEGQAQVLRPRRQFVDMRGWDDSISSHRPC